MRRVVASELVRLRRPGLLGGWLGLTAVFAVLVNMVMFQISAEGTSPEQGPGVTFPPLAELTGSGGLVAGLAATSSFFGVVALSFWALSAAGDHSTGLVRILVAAEPRRWRLILGKWLALSLVTAAATLVALAANLVIAPVAASVAAVEPTGWGDGTASVILEATGQLYLALLVWGSIGLALAVTTRSAGIAIGAGVGWVLLVEGVVTAALEGARDWVPGATISALASGGTSSIPFATALTLGATYTVIAVGASVATFARRDITD